MNNAALTKLRNAGRPLTAGEWGVTPAIREELETLGLIKVWKSGRATMSEAVEPHKACAEEPRKAQKEAVTPLFLVAEQQTYFSERREFIDAIVEQAVGQFGDAFKLSAGARTMPKLIKAYTKLLEEDEIKALLFQTARRYARSR